MTTKGEQRRGTLLGVVAYLLWGFAALYWIQTEPVATTDLLAHRAVWSLPFVAICLFLAGGGRLLATLALLREPRTLGIMAVAALLGATNWGVFLWAVTHERATEASLGYFLVPLVNVVLGIVLFRESLDRPRRIAIGFALAAVVVQVVAIGHLPLVALTLALSFGFYGAIRKGVHIESMEGLFLETLLIAPFGIAWMLFREGAGLGVHGWQVDLFLLGAGAFTAIPLMCYVAASRLLPLTALGLVFYIGPTSQLLVAVLIFGEPFTLAQLIAFTLVWVGLILMTLDSFRRERAVRRRSASETSQAT